MSTTMPTTRISHSPAASRRALRYVLMALVAGVLGVVTASFPAWRGPALDMMLVIGEAQLARLGSGAIRRDGTSEYLVVLRGDEHRDESLRFIDRHPGVAFEGDSIFPRTQRVALRVPVGNPRRDLQELPYVSMVLPATPLFFCH